MKKRNLLWYVLIAAVSAAIGIYANSARLKPQTAQAQALANLFTQTLPDPSGQAQRLSKWQGQALLINFWASWCGPCVEEMPELVALQKQLPQIQIIGIGIDSASKIAEFATKRHIDYPLYVADSSAINTMRTLGNQVGGLPFTLLVRADGSIAKSYIGALHFDQLRNDIAAMLPR